MILNAAAVQIFIALQWARQGLAKTDLCARDPTPLQVSQRLLLQVDGVKMGLRAAWSQPGRSIYARSKVLGERFQHCPFMSQLGWKLRAVVNLEHHLLFHTEIFLLFGWGAWLREIISSLVRASHYWKYNSLFCSVFRFGLFGIMMLRRCLIMGLEAQTGSYLLYSLCAWASIYPWGNN